MTRTRHVLPLLGLALALALGGLAAAPAGPAAASVPAKGVNCVTYVVRAGDTLYSLANRYGTTVQQIKADNGLTSDYIYVGQRLQICQSPSGCVGHVVQPGDTLYSLANRYGTTVDKIKQDNGLSSDTIYVGQTLQICGGGGSGGSGGIMVGGQARVVARSGANLRRSPGHTGKPAGDVIMVVPYGAIVNVIGGPTSANGLPWWQVTYGAAGGWMAERSGTQTLLVPAGGSGGVGPNFIRIDSPRPGQQVTSPLVVAGMSQTFEGNVVLQLFAQGASQPLAQTTATGGSMSPAPFRATLPFSVGAPTPGQLVAFWTDPATGAQMNRTQLGLTLLPGSGGQGSYLVQPGDTLWGIAKRYNTTVEALMRANGLTSGAINAGQTLVIPPPTPAPPLDSFVGTVNNDVVNADGASGTLTMGQHDPGMNTVTWNSATRVYNLYGPVNPVAGLNAGSVIEVQAVPSASGVLQAQSIFIIQ
jgi:LysM repeat protein